MAPLARKYTTHIRPTHRVSQISQNYLHLPTLGWRVKTPRKTFTGGERHRGNPRAEFRGRHCKITQRPDIIADSKERPIPYDIQNSYIFVIPLTLKRCNQSSDYTMAMELWNRWPKIPHCNKSQYRARPLRAEELCFSRRQFSNCGFLSLQRA